MTRKEKIRALSYLQAPYTEDTLKNALLLWQYSHYQKVHDLLWEQYEEAIMPHLSTYVVLLKRALRRGKLGKLIAVVIVGRILLLCSSIERKVGYQELDYDQLNILQSFYSRLGEFRRKWKDLSISLGEMALEKVFNNENSKALILAKLIRDLQFIGKNDEARNRYLQIKDLFSDLNATTFTRVKQEMARYKLSLAECDNALYLAQSALNVAESNGINDQVISATQLLKEIQARCN